MTEIIRRSRLFVGSYALLFVLLAIRFTTPWLEITCGALAVIGFADMAWIVFVVSRRSAADPVRVETSRDAGAEIAGYLATYLLPFLTVAEPSWRDLTAYAIFLVVTGLIYVQSEMTQVNPTLYLMGRRVVHVTTDGGWQGFLVVKSRSLTREHPIRVASLNQSVRVEVVSSEPNA